MAAVFEVLADEGRRRILDVLAEGERPVGELVELLALSQPAVSKHLKVLREAGLVQSRTDAQTPHLPDPAGAPPRSRRLVGALPAAMGGHLNALERHLEIMETGERAMG